jgi:hypothetical protein
MTLYKGLEEIIDSWGKYLTGIETKMQFSIKAILNEIIGNNNIFAIFFEYEYDIMDLSFFAIDDKENILMVKQDIVNKELNSKTLFPEDLLDKQDEIIDEYDGEDDNFDEIYDEYTQQKEDIFKKWFKSCWNEAIKRYNNIPNSFFSIHDTNYKINLKTNEEITYDEIIE